MLILYYLDNEALFDSRKFKAMGDIGKLLEDRLIRLLFYGGS